jgi:hypothetical protein
MVRLLTVWRAISRLTHKGAALGFIFLVLLPVISTADDFHTCALHGLAAKYHPSQLYEFHADDNAGQAPCLACYWQSVLDPVYGIGLLWVEFQPLCALSVAPHTVTQPGAYFVRYGRAPPQVSF